MAADQITNSIYASFINSSSFYLICVDSQGHYTYVNPCFARRFSFINPNFVGSHMSASVHPPDLAKAWDVVAACMASPGKTFTLRIRMTDGKGSMAWSQWETSALKDQEDRVQGIICLGYDITEGQHAQREALQYAMKLENIIENIADGFLIINRNWEFVKANKVFEEIVGVERQQVLGKSLWDVFPDNGTYQYPKAYRRAMLEHATSYFIDYNVEAQRWYEGTAYPSEEGLTVLFRDITEKKQAEEKIRESRNKLSAILNSTSDINILVDPQYKILSFNKTALESMRVLYDNKSIEVGQNILDYILPGTVEDFIKYFGSALKGEPVEVKIKLFFKPGLALWFLVKYFPVYDSDNNIMGVAFSSTNINQQQRQYEKLEEIANLYSHDIRRPVATILGITQLIEQEDLTFENKEWFGHLRKTTQELDRVIHQIVIKTSEIG
ncbi:PAS domain-containing protein [Flammeovirgaceae bacterium 311]|nr:PAS domain-containing protein [Flammeovirgaceae bacterium 311]